VQVQAVKQIEQYAVTSSINSALGRRADQAGGGK
jgi:hypothetical protein